MVAPRIYSLFYKVSSDPTISHNQVFTRICSIFPKLSATLPGYTLPLIICLCRAAAQDHQVCVTAHHFCITFIKTLLQESSILHSRCYTLYCEWMCSSNSGNMSRGNTIPGGIHSTTV